MLNSVLSGIIVIIGTVWAWYALNRLMQESLQREAAAGLEAARAAGFALRPPEFRARLVAMGTLDGRDVRVEWRDGVLGPRSVVRVGGRSRRTALITDAATWAAALHG